jgi:filamentous hemagglutinin family protein
LDIKISAVPQVDPTTSIVVDTTLPSASSGTVPGVSNGATNTYTLASNYGVQAGTNEYYSFNTFNLYNGDIADFSVANSITNIISRVTGGASTTIDGKIISPVGVWFLNPAGVIVGSGATMDVSGGFHNSAADYVAFANGDRWYAIDANATAGNPSVLSMSTPMSFGFLSNVELDSSLGIYSTNKPITPANGVYTLTPSEGLISGPSSPTATNPSYNVFFSFANFVVGTNETALFTNDSTNPAHASGSYANVISRVTGGNPTSIDGTIDSSGLPNASFWFINPSGIIVTKNAVFNLNGTIALGAADYINFADGTQFYASPGNGPNPDLPSSANPLTSGSLAFGMGTFGFVPQSTAGSFQANGWDLEENPISVGGTHGGVILAGGSGVTLTDTTIYSVAPLPGSASHLTDAVVDIISNGDGVTLSNSKITADNTWNNSISADLNITAASGDITLTGSKVMATAAGGYAGASNLSPAGNITLNAMQGNLELAQSIIHSEFSEYPSSGQIGDIGSGNVALDGLGITANGVSIESQGGPTGNVTINVGSGVANLTGTTVSSATLFTFNGEAPYPRLLNSGSVDVDAGTIDASNSSFLAAGSTYYPDAVNGGNVRLQALQNVSLTSATIDATSAGLNSKSLPIGSAGTITVGAGGSITAQSSVLESSVSGTLIDGPSSPPGSGSAGLITLHATAGNVSLTDTALGSAATKAGNAGGIMVSTGGTLTISGNTFPADPNLPGPIKYSLSSQSMQSGEAGPISLTAAGAVSISNGANISSSVNGSTNTTSANIGITSTAASVSLSDATISTTSSNGGGPAGGIAIKGATGVSIAVGTGSAIISTSASDSSENAGPIAITSEGLVDISGTQITSESSQGTGNGGNIQVSGSGVLIAQQSRLSANYDFGGGTPGSPGSVAVVATGSTALNDPLSSNLTAATPGVVRIVDSAVTASNTGGIGHGGAVGGQVWIGMDLPGSSGAISDDVIIAGSVVSTDVSAGGIGNTLTVEANRGIWIGVSPTGGYIDPTPGYLDAQGTVPDERTAPTQSLISALAGQSAASAGQILIQGGERGVSILSSDLDADNQIIAMNNGEPNSKTADIQITSAGGPVTLTGATVTAESTGIDAGGNIGISGQTVSLMGGSISASSNPTADLPELSTFPGGNAGTILITAKGADPSSTVSALQIGGGATVSSAASGVAVTAANSGVEAGNAGTITLTASASNGSVKLGLPADTVLTTVSTSAGATAGAAGAISVTGNSIRLAKANLNTAAAGTEPSLETASAGSISLTANNGTGQLSLTNSALDATTSGAQKAGEIDLAGSQIEISSTSIASGTSSASAAGDINITGQRVNILGSAAGNAITVSTTGSGNAGYISIKASGANPIAGNALQIDRMSIESTAAGVTGNSPGSVGSAGTITITASNGSVSLGDMAANVAPTRIESSADQYSGQAGKVTIGSAGKITAQDTTVDTSVATTQTSNASGAFTPSTISLTAPGAVALTGSTLTAKTGGAIAAGDITVSGSTVNLLGSTAEASTSGAGDAGKIGITASTADIAGGSALQITGGSTISSDASSGKNGASAGAVTLTADQGTVQIGASTDTTKTLVSTSAGASAGAAGGITVTGTGISLGDANLSTTAGGAAPNSTRGTISLIANKGMGPVSIVSSTLNAATSGVQQAGEVDVQGGAVTINTSAISSSTTGSGNAGNISISASATGTPSVAALELSGTTVQSTATGSATTTAGNAGTISLAANNGSVSLGGTTPSAATQIETSANVNAGEAGTIKITSGGDLTAQDTAINTSVATTASTPGFTSGTITLSAPRGITVGSGTQINANTAGSAPGGSIQFVTPGAVSVSGAGTLISSNTSGNGIGGDIDFGSIAAPIASLTVNGGAGVSVNASRADALAGNGGAILIASTGPVTLSGAGTALSSLSSNDAVGGSVTLNASSLTMDDGAVISADTSSNPVGGAQPASSREKGVRAPNDLSSITTGGSIAVKTSGDVSLAGRGTSISAKASGTGSGGTVNIQAADLTLSDGAQIATTATGPGNSGTIAIVLPPTTGTAPTLSLNDSQILTSATQSTGGNIDIAAQGNPLTLTNAVIAASSNGGAGSNGGNITITGVGRTILTGSGILAQANQGNGGAITLSLQPGALFVEDAESLVSATSTAGNNGTVTINAPQTDLNAALAVPDVSVERAPELSANACRRDAKRSTFIVEGRGGIKPPPDAYQSGGPAPSAPPAIAAEGTDPVPLEILQLMASIQESGCR